MALTTPSTYKQLIEAFEQICLSQISVKHFQVGEMSDVDIQTNTETFQRYPFVFLIPRASSMDRFGKMVLGFSLIVADIAKNEEDLQVNVHNETLMIMQDIFSKIIMTPASQVDWDVETPIRMVPFVEKYNNNLAGWTAEINVLMISPFNLCDAAFN
jgi:predicted amino acid-binding ACT domain protein